MDKYLMLLLKSARYGFIEVVFNFDRNCGINKNGEVILFDFTEITTDLNTALNLIKEKIWLKKESYKNLTPSLKKYFKNSMTKKISEEKIKRIWMKLKL